MRCIGFCFFFVISCEIAHAKGNVEDLHARRSEAVPKTIDTRVRHAVTSCTLSFPFGEAYFVRVCDLLCVPSFLKFWCGGDRLRFGTRDTFKSFAVSVSFCSICVARSCEIDHRVVRKDGSVCVSLSDLQIQINVCCSVPDGDEHSFPWIYGCHQACVGANATMFRFVLELCSSSLHST